VGGETGGCGVTVTVCVLVILTSVFSIPGVLGTQPEIRIITARIEAASMVFDLHDLRTEVELGFIGLFSSWIIIA
jgi:hypothetical protein